MGLNFYRMVQDLELVAKLNSLDAADGRYHFFAHTLTESKTGKRRWQLSVPQERHTCSRWQLSAVLPSKVILTATRNLLDKTYGNIPPGEEEKKCAVGRILTSVQLVLKSTAG